MDIDLVYNYVNGNDTEWVEKRNQFAMNEHNTACRFRDNKELLYSLRSVEKYAPWIRRIYIIMDSKVPEWLNLDNDKLRIVTHEEIIPAEYLPTYNSNVIEQHMFNIEGLSEIFLYANDDMFFGNHVSEDFFVKDGKPVIRLVKYAVGTPTNNYNWALYNARELFYEKYGVRYDLIPTHNIDVYSKSGMKLCSDEFADTLKPYYFNRLRSDKEIQRVLFYYYLINHDKCSLVVYKESKLYRFISTFKKMINPEKYLDFLVCNINAFCNSRVNQILFGKNPRLVCMNDSDSTTDSDLVMYGDVMSKKFPDKSSFEK